MYGLVLLNSDLWGGGEEGVTIVYCLAFGPSNHSYWYRMALVTVAHADVILVYVMKPFVLTRVECCSFVYSSL